MSLAEKYCITAAFIFFMTGLITGIWKYSHMARRDNARSPLYVDVAHRSSLMYSFAAILLGQLASVSRFPEQVNAWAALIALSFFGLAILSYVVHGVLQDTNNQFKRPHRLGSLTLPNILMGLFMAALIIGEIGGALTLGLGAMLHVWDIKI